MVREEWIPTSLSLPKPLAGSGRVERDFKGHTGSVNGTTFSSDGRRVLSGSHDRTVRLWDVQTGSEVHRLTGHTDTVMSVAFAPGNAIP